jgi:hypothetical protein
MNDWKYFFNPVLHNLEQGSYRIFEPQWKAEILHWFKREDVEKAEKEAFIQALIDFDDGCGDFYRYRAYFLAAEAIAYFPACSLGDEIVGQLLKWSYAYFRQDKRDWKIYPQPLVQAARAGLERTDKARVIAAFTQIVHSTESRAILQCAARKLGQLDPGNKSAIAALFLLFQAQEYDSLTVDTPETITEERETKIAALIDSIQTMPDESIIWNTIIALGEIGCGNQDAIATLVHLMETTLNKSNCYGAIAALSKIGCGNETAIAAFVKFLKINQGDTICYDAARALWQIDPGNVAAIAALVYILETNRNIYLLDWAAEYLLQIDPGNKAAIATLFQMLETIQDKETCLRVSELLAHANDYCQKVKAIAMLIEFIQTFQQDNDTETRTSASPTLWLSYDSCLLDLAERLKAILPIDYLPQVVIAFKDYLGEPFYKNSSYRYEAAYNLIWHCTQNMPYPAFYKVWVG